MARVHSSKQLQRLQIALVSDLSHRRVELHCGSPLTAAMNSQLQISTNPFGAAVHPLRPKRLTFAVRILWSPLPAGGELQPLPPEQQDGGQALILPKELTSGHQPFSDVHEHYQAEVLAFRRNR